MINKEKMTFSSSSHQVCAERHQQQQQQNFKSQTLTTTTTSNSIAKLAITESFSDTYESDYSTITPSKNKKVVYEVIV
jgi:hypothetical protein